MPKTLFKKGDPRINRKGRPKGAKSYKPPTQLMREFGLMDAEELKNKLVRGKMNVLERIAAVTILSSLTPKNHNTRVDMFNRLEGTPVQRVSQNLSGVIGSVSVGRYRFGDLTEADMLALKKVVSKLPEVLDGDGNDDPQD
jgi:hypothetical protein